MYEQSLYHDDIKPSNILIGPRVEGVLTDYGISCLSPKGLNFNAFRKRIESGKETKVGAMTVKI